MVYSCKDRTYIHGTDNSIECQKRFWEYLQEHLVQDLQPPLVVLSKDQTPFSFCIKHTTFLESSTISPSQSLRFLVHFLDETEGCFHVFSPYPLSLGPNAFTPVSVPCLSSIVAAVLHPPAEQHRDGWDIYL